MTADNGTVKRHARLRLNVIDFLIAIVILGAIIGIALRFGVVEKVTNQSGLVPARISFLIQDINDASADYFVVGDEFISVTHNCIFGKLEATQTMPAEAFVVNEYGEIFKTYSENHRIDVRGTIIGNGIFNDDGFLLSGTNYLAPGSSMHVQSSNLDVWLTVTAIEKVEEQK